MPGSNTSVSSSVSAWLPAPSPPTSRAWMRRPPTSNNSSRAGCAADRPTLAWIGPGAETGETQGRLDIGRGGIDGATDPRLRRHAELEGLVGAMGQEHAGLARAWTRG